MKKVLLGLFLLAALIAVSYIKSERESERQAQSFIDGHDVGARKSELVQYNTDSLEQLIDQKATEVVELRTTMADTLAERDQQYAETIDSLGAIIMAGQEEIAALEKKVAASKKAAKKSSSTSDSAAPKAAHKDILKYYRLAVAKLPADLSTYEYRVSVAEIRTETAAKFKITVARLDEIRVANNLDY